LTLSVFTTILRQLQKFVAGIEIMNLQIVFCPFVTRQRFAEMVGVTSDTLERWIRDGRVSTHRIGKRSLVDMRQWLSSDAANTSQFGPRGKSA